MTVGGLVPVAVRGFITVRRFVVTITTASSGRDAIGKRRVLEGVAHALGVGVAKARRVDFVELDAEMRRLGHFAALARRHIVAKEFLRVGRPPGLKCDHD